MKEGKETFLTDGKLVVVFLGLILVVLLAQFIVRPSTHPALKVGVVYKPNGYQNGWLLIRKTKGNWAYCEFINNGGTRDPKDMRKTRWINMNSHTHFVSKSGLDKFGKGKKK